MGDATDVGGLLEPGAAIVPGTLGSGVSVLLLLSALSLVIAGQVLLWSGRISWRFGFDPQRRLGRWGRFCRSSGVLALLFTLLQWLAGELPFAMAALLFASVLVALAVMGTLQDAAGGMYAQFRLRLREGDRVRVGQHEGELRSLHWEHLNLRRRDGTSVYVPNRMLLREPVHVYAMRNAVPLRLRLPDVDSPPDELSRLRDTASVLPYRVPGTPLDIVRADGNLELRMYVWSEEARPAAERRLRTAVRDEEDEAEER